MILAIWQIIVIVALVGIVSFISGALILLHVLTKDFSQSQLLKAFRRD